MKGSIDIPYSFKLNKVDFVVMGHKLWLDKVSEPQPCGRKLLHPLIACKFIRFRGFKNPSIDLN